MRDKWAIEIHELILTVLISTAMIGIIIVLGVITIQLITGNLPCHDKDSLAD